MCEFCSKYRHGNRWYLNPKSFSDELLAQPAGHKVGTPLGEAVDDVGCGSRARTDAGQIAEADQASSVTGLWSSYPGCKGLSSTHNC